MKILRYVLYVLIAIFFLLQFVPAELPENSAEVSNDIVMSSGASEEIQSILRKACYDCHSKQTKYPWYSFVAPVSWLIAKDTREGREELNFSEWAGLSKRKKIKALNDIAEEVEEKKMPLKIYTVVHRDAILSDQEIEALMSWTKSLSDNILSEN